MLNHLEFKFSACTSFYFFLVNDKDKEKQKPLLIISTHSIHENLRYKPKTFPLWVLFQGCKLVLQEYWANLFLPVPNIYTHLHTSESGIGPIINSINVEQVKKSHAQQDLNPILASLCLQCTVWSGWLNFKIRR